MPTYYNLVPFRIDDKDNCDVLSRIEQKINNLETIVLEQNSDSTPTSRDNEIGADNINLRHIMSKLAKIEAKLGKNTHRRRNNRR